MNIKYLAGRIVNMDIKNMFRAIDTVHERSGKNRVYIFFDMIHCGVKYGAGYSDYKLAEFYNLNRKQRATYITRGINNRLVSLLNKKEDYYLVEDKRKFNEIFGDLIHREWLNMDTATQPEFEAFMAERSVIIAKPSDATCGKGIEKLDKKDFTSLQAMYTHLKETGAGLVEDCIIQHRDIAKLYPLSVNTLRIVTVYTEGEAHLIYAFIRIGNDGHFVDNFNSGGMVAPIDTEKGVIQYAAFDKQSRYYETHPYTRTPIAGSAIPFWKESVALCLTAAARIPTLGYIGWDVAVTEDGPLLIEANQFPGHDILQMPPHVPDKVGMLPKFKKYVKNL